MIISNKVDVYRGGNAIFRLFTLLYRLIGEDYHRYEAEKNNSYLPYPLPILSHDNWMAVFKG